MNGLLDICKQASDKFQHLIMRKNSLSKIGIKMYFRLMKAVTEKVKKISFLMVRLSLSSKEQDKNAHYPPILFKVKFEFLASGTKQEKRIRRIQEPARKKQNCHFQKECGLNVGKLPKITSKLLEIRESGKMYTFDIILDINKIESLPITLYKNKFSKN